MRHILKWVAVPGRTQALRLELDQGLLQRHQDRLKHVVGSRQHLAVIDLAACKLSYRDFQIQEAGCDHSSYCTGVGLGLLRHLYQYVKAVDEAAIGSEHSQCMFEVDCEVVAPVIVEAGSEVGSEFGVLAAVRVVQKCRMAWLEAVVGD